eukprot:CAMPEP_0114225276 /NCGR_PEP_ID=MMETSP0058-20121206/574_1 /TAXON_ID=36894 /ORGANISM="Pyramimonas parkeae, CCMP726" /LENGTH=57 /DNA_ID=CAMNT_0001335847 /DNA_START=1005 /DNA_END=1178 /DNA_ORIENTATION=+
MTSASSLQVCGATTSAALMDCTHLFAKRWFGSGKQSPQRQHSNHFASELQIVPLTSA